MMEWVCNGVTLWNVQSPCTMSQEGKEGDSKYVRMHVRLASHKWTREVNACIKWLGPKAPHTRSSITVSLSAVEPSAKQDKVESGKARS